MVTPNRITGRILSLFGLLCFLGMMPLVIGLTGCASERSQQTIQSDNSISEQVKKALDADPVYKYGKVYISTHDGVVQLGGFTDTKEQKDRAGVIAKGVPGVRDVDNKIKD